MAVQYVDPATVHDPTTGAVIPAAWGDVVRDDLEALIDPPACAVFNSTAQSVPTNTPTALTANSELFDNDAMHSTSSNTSRITVQKAGRYLFIATVGFAVSAGSIASITFRRNAGADVAGSTGTNTAVGGRLTGVKMFTLAAGEFIEVRAFHSHGSNLNVTLDEFAGTFITRG